MEDKLNSQFLHVFISHLLHTRPGIKMDLIAYELSLSLFRINIILKHDASHWVSTGRFIQIQDDCTLMKCICGGKESNRTLAVTN